MTGDGSKPPEEELGSVLVWVWAAQRQIERILGYYAHDVTVYSPTVPDDAPEGSWMWEEWHAAIDTDLHFFLIAMGQVVKYCELLDDDRVLPLADDLQRDIPHMRNVWEHWEDHREAFREGGPFKRSGAHLADLYPGVHPRAQTTTPEIGVGPIPLRRSWQELCRLEEQVRSIRAPRGTPPESSRRRMKPQEG